MNEPGAIKRVGAVAVTSPRCSPRSAGCGGSSRATPRPRNPATSTLPQSSEPSNLNPADFTTQIDNPYFPLPVGARWDVRVTNQEGELSRRGDHGRDKTKQIADGVTARVVHDVVSEGGKPAEITDDWYAQDKDGNVWYFGEDTAEIHERQEGHQRVVRGRRERRRRRDRDARPPEVGQTYREEYYAGHAEDRSQGARARPAGPRRPSATSGTRS